MKLVTRVIAIVIVVFSVFPNKSYSQDPEFTQFYANLLYLNPAFAGAANCPRVALNYRNQWPAFGPAYVTYSASYDQFVASLEGGLGLLLMQDVQADGAINTTGIHAMYSYTMNVTRRFSLKAGFQATYIQKKLNWDYIFPDMIHPLYGVIYQTKEDDIQEAYDNNMNIFDFSAGMIGFGKTYFFGVAVHHLTEPQESFRSNSDAVLPRKYTLHYGANIPLNGGRRFKRGQLKISPNMLFQQQGNYQQINYGVYLDRKSIVFGLWFRQNFKPHADAFIMVLGFVQDKMKFAYSYDLTVSKLKNHTYGSHEVSFSTIFNCKKKPKRFRSVSCPSF